MKMNREEVSILSGEKIDSRVGFCLLGEKGIVAKGRKSACKLRIEIAVD